jgi:hypothetical protein
MTYHNQINPVTDTPLLRTPHLCLATARLLDRPFHRHCPSLYRLDVIIEYDI